MNTAPPCEKRQNRETSKLTLRVSLFPRIESLLPIGSRVAEFLFDVVHLAAEIGDSHSFGFGVHDRLRLVVVVEEREQPEILLLSQWVELF